MFTKNKIQSEEYLYECSSCHELWTLDKTCTCNKCKQYRLPLTHCPKCGDKITTKEKTNHG